MNDQQKVDALVRARDGLRQASDALDDLVQLLIPQNIMKDPTKLPFDVAKIPWIDRANEKGKFQVSEDYDNPDHKALLKFLNEHAGGCIQSKDGEGRN
jgi:hypothetical protein